MEKIRTEKFAFDWKVPKIASSFIDGKDARAFLKEYNERVDAADYKGNSNLKILDYSEGVVEGSNPSAVVLVNKILRPQGIRTATPADIERVVESGALYLRRHYENTALVLRGKNSYSNPILAKDVGVQIKGRGFKFPGNNPVMIPLNGFDLVTADKDYSLVLKLRDDALLYNAPELRKSNAGRNFLKGNDKGLPILDRKGYRVVYTHAGSDGLLSMLLDSELNIGMDWDEFEISNSGGRIVLVSDVISHRNSLDTYIGGIKFN